ncbi:MAG TPA: excinuclease ABC subunit UvrC, partial [bacterium]
DRMKDLATQKCFEEAAMLRDEIHSIAAFQSRQKVVDEMAINRDIVVTAQEGGLGCGLVFNVRDGKIVNRIHFFLENVETLEEPEILANFLKLYYIRTDDIPDTVMLPASVPDSFGIEAWLSKKGGKDVRFEFPKRGKTSRLMDMCRENAKLLLSELILQKEKSDDWTAPSVAALQKDLSLPKAPKRIEAFDVSNLGGKDTVASMVVFENGQPKKSEYRKFIIRRVEGIDDYQSMAEVLERRIRRIQKEQKPMPDLLLVDGGKGQLSAAVGVLKKMNAEGQPVIGLAKRLEEVFVPGHPDPQNIPKTSAGLRLLQRVRDEAHRFAVAYHRTLRKKRTVRSELDDIPGIGEKRRKNLLIHFKSVNNLKKASIEEIASVEGMNRKAAERVSEMLGKKEP